MKINQKQELASPLVQTAGGKTATSAAAPAEAAKPSASSKASSSASVTLSQAAQALSGSVSAEFDSKKVESVRAAIANGTFTVDAQAVADKMLSNAQEVLARVRG